MSSIKCLYCQGEMQKSTAPFSISRKGYHIHWNEIAAYVCSQCGEPYFEAETVDKIQAALSALEESGKELINI